MQSILGAIMTAGYAAAMSKSIAASPEADQVTSSTQNQLTKSFAGAENTAQTSPQYSDQIIAAAKEAFLAGGTWAFGAGVPAVIFGAGLVVIFFPGREAEAALTARYEAEDEAACTLEHSAR